MHEEHEQSPAGRSKAPIERYWEWLLHEDDLFSSRISFFLIAETMILIAFAINAYENPDLTKILGIAGILFVVIWLYVSAVQLMSITRPIKDRLREQMPEYREVKDVWLLGDPNVWLGIVFPIVIIGMWIALIVLD